MANTLRRARQRAWAAALATHLLSGLILASCAAPKGTAAQDKAERELRHLSSKQQERGTRSTIALQSYLFEPTAAQKGFLGIEAVPSRWHLNASYRSLFIRLEPALFGTRPTRVLSWKGFDNPPASYVESYVLLSAVDFSPEAYVGLAGLAETIHCLGLFGFSAYHHLASVEALANWQRGVFPRVGIDCDRLSQSDMADEFEKHYASGMAIRPVTLARIRVDSSRPQPAAVHVQDVDLLGKTHESPKDSLRKDAFLHLRRSSLFFDWVNLELAGSDARTTVYGALPDAWIASIEDHFSQLYAYDGNLHQDYGRGIFFDQENRLLELTLDNKLPEFTASRMWHLLCIAAAGHDPILGLKNGWRPPGGRTESNSKIPLLDAYEQCRQLPTTTTRSSTNTR